MKCKSTDLAQKYECEHCKQLQAENVRLKKAILDFGNNPAGLDWGVLECLEQQENKIDELKVLLKEAQPHICSHLCPSIKKIEEEWTHCKLCEEITKALKGI